MAKQNQHHSTAATARKTKLQSQKTIQTQTFNILQNVFECSVAGICKDRNLFPAHFFQDYETNDDHLLVTNFDMDVLLGNDSCRDSTTCSGSGSTLSHARERDSDVGNITTSSDNSNELKQQLLSNTSKSSNLSSRSSNNNNSNDVLHLDNDLPSLSPLTSSVMPTACSESTPSTIMSSLNSNKHDIDGNNRNYCGVYTHHQLSRQLGEESFDHYQYDHNQHFKTEALLLIHWIRNGVMEMIKRDQLAKFIFAICVPPNGSSHNQNNNHEQEDEKEIDYKHCQTIHSTSRTTTFSTSMTETKEENQKRSRMKKKKDRIVESYVFDMSQLNLKSNYNDNNYKDGNNNFTNDKTDSCRKQINHRQMQIQYDRLFRNLQSFSKTVVPPIQQYQRQTHSYEDGTNTSTKNSQQNQRNENIMTPVTTCSTDNVNDTCGNSFSDQNLTLIPHSRYFNIKVEFKKKNNQNEGSIRDTVIEKKNNEESIACAESKIDVLELPMALNPLTSINSQFVRLPNKHNNGIPSITKSMDKLVPLPLGHVVEENVTGLGVKLIAYHCEDNDDIDNNDDDDTEDIEDAHYSNKRKIGATYIGSIKGDFISKDDSDLLRKKRRIGIQEEESLMSYQHLTIIGKHSKAFALPHYPKCTDKRKERLPLYLPCEILDHRIRKTSNLDYKVLFLDQILDNAKMKKQWISSKKVFLPEKLREKANKRLKEVMDSNDTEKVGMTTQTVIQRVAKEMNVSLATIKHLTRDNIDDESKESLYCANKIDNFPYSGKNHKLNTPKTVIGSNTISSTIKIDDISEMKLIFDETNNFTVKYCYAVDPISLVI